MRLDGKRRILALTGLLAIALMCAFPPWLHTVQTVAVYSQKPAGYHFVGTPPKPDGETRMHGVRLDGVRLGFQCLGVAALVAFGWLVTGGRGEAGLGSGPTGLEH